MRVEYTNATDSFIWRDGTDFVYAKFRINEPSNSEKREYCLHIVANEMTWNDLDCGFTNSYAKDINAVCEKSCS